MSQQQIWIVYGDRDFNGGFSNVFYSQDEAHQWIAELLEIDFFDGFFEESDALEAYENGKWKCLECDCHEVDSGAITSNHELTHLSLGDVRSAHAILDEMVEGAHEGSIDIFFDLPDRLETLRDLLQAVLDRHHVCTGEAQ